MELPPILQPEDAGQSKSRVFALIASGAVTFLLFLAIPLTQMISGYRERPQLVRSLDVSLPPPPPPPQEPPPPPEEKQQEQKPELEQPQPKLNLSQLEAALNPGTGGAMGGGITFDLRGMAADDLDRIFELTDLDRRPQAIYQVPPQYPPALNRAGVEGLVTIIFIVDREGRVQQPQIESSTRSEFERPAMDALRQWRFEPGIRNGVRVATKMSVPIRFTLRR